MPKIFFPIVNLSENPLSIKGEKARYLATVLRCVTGDELIVFNGRGNCLRTRILKISRKEVFAEVLREFDCNMESSLDIILVQGLLKGRKMDMIIQKATELGVREFQPVITQRSQLRDTRKVARWRKIAEESSEQSGRSFVPIIHEPMGFNDFLSSLTVGTSPGALKGYIFYEEGGMRISETVSETVKEMKRGKRGITEKGDRFLVVIGPEGGFTREEIMDAENRGLIVITLGKRILRAETAAIAATTLVQFLLGDLS
jgi:16S rRNA (uracil1498-N3)-methyltransferase